MRHALAVALLLVVVAGASCDNEGDSHVYVAQRYETARDCLDPSTSLDVITTAQAGLACAPTCLVQPSPPAPNGGNVYVSTMCGPYPANLDTSGTDARCPLALAAYARGPDVCNSDGTSTNPIDAGADGGGGSSDGGEDASSGDDGPSDDVRAPSDAKEDAREVSGD
jgi:hypothetical protein